LVYYKEICHDAWSHERQNGITCVCKGGALHMFARGFLIRVLIRAVDAHAERPMGRS